MRTTHRRSNMSWIIIHFFSKRKGSDSNCLCPNIENEIYLSINMKYDVNKL